MGMLASNEQVRARARACSPLISKERERLLASSPRMSRDRIRHVCPNEQVREWHAAAGLQGQVCRAPSRNSSSGAENLSAADAKVAPGRKLEQLAKSPAMYHSTEQPGLSLCLQDSAIQPSSYVKRHQVPTPKYTKSQEFLVSRQATGVTECLSYREGQPMPTFWVRSNTDATPIANNIVSRPRR
eukprot:1152607-Pelagomonas_calceolata.AAC.4